LEFGEHWYAIGLSTNQPENFQGYHSPHLLFVVDEASGVSQKIFEAGEGFLTSPGAKTLLIGNPTQVGGEFYSAFHSARALYNTIHVSAFATPSFTDEEVPDHVGRVLPSEQWVERMRVKYKVPKEHERGVDADGKPVRLNPVYEVRVIGNFPSQGDRAVVPMYEVENAQKRDLRVEEERRAEVEGRDPVAIPTWPVVVSCDVARFGDDETVIAIRNGNRARIVDVANGRDTMATAGMILRTAAANHHPERGKPVIVIDDDGIGGGVTDRLRELASELETGGYRVIVFHAGAAAAEENQDVGGYPNARSEVWFEFAEDWLPLLDLDEDEDLLADLCAPEYAMNSKGQRVVEPKADTKKRLGRSPDRADAILLLYSRPVNAGLSLRAPSGPPQTGGSKWSGLGGGTGAPAGMSAPSRWRR
jgi:hypothetical protein